MSDTSNNPDPRLDTPVTSGGDDPASNHQTMRVCAGVAIPPGWIKINDLHDSIQCGGPSQPGIRNVWVLEKYDRPDWKVGHEMEVCSDAPTPSDWVEVHRYHSLIGCSPPSAPDVYNMKRIKKIS